MTPRRQLAVAVAAAALLLTGACAATQAPAAPPRRTVPAAPTSDPAHPCTREAAAGAAAPDTGGPVTATFDKATNTVLVTQGQNVTLTAVRRAVGTDAALKEVTTGEWLLGANLEVDKGASLLIQSPEVRWLKLSSGTTSFVTLKAVGGGLTIKGSCITSWDDTAQRASTIGTTSTDAVDPDSAAAAAALQQGRSYVFANDGAAMNIDHAELSYLGYGDRESYGLLWRNEGTTGHLKDSIVSHNYFGLYTFDVGGLEISGNDVYENTVYGIDPHTGSHDLKILNNSVHDNGKHGIILAEKCINSVISGNIVYRNQHHGIVLYQHSDKNTVENNDTFDNASQGVNINESADNTVVDNRIYNNQESGIGVTDTGQDNTLRQNDIRGNKVDGIRLVTAATTTTVLNNVIGQNGRYGVYVDSNGPFTLTDNTIFSNKTGVQMKGTSNPTTSGNSIFDNEDADIRSG